MTTLDQLLKGIRQEESGGNYHVVNSIGAVGAYQVMKANIPSWTKKALGYSLTWQQFRDSPAAQDKVARVILGGYYNKYGAEGAASMWFSGQPNPNKAGSDGSTSIRHYVDNVISLSGGSPSSGGGGGGGAVGSPVAPLDTASLAQQYGLSAAMINSSRELKSLFKQAVAGTWTADRFQAALKNTKWWSTQSDSLRKYITLKYTDPATWKQNWSAGQAAINSLAVQVGLGNQINARGQSSQLLQDAIYNSLALGWTDARVKDWLGARVSVSGGHLSGEAADAFDKLHAAAYANGIKLSDAWYLGAVRGVAGGKSTEEAAEDQIRHWAAAKYSAFSDQIKAGQNVSDLAAPYVQSVAKILEVPDTDVDVFNSHVSKAMMTNVKSQAQTIWEFENSLRKDPAWKKTQNAQDSATSTAHQVLQQFGMVF